MQRRTFLMAGTCAALASPALSSPVKLRDLYKRDGSFSDYAYDNLGKRISLDGFMAPPLKANAAFFVLTRMPLTVCPFCETEEEWPEDILAVYTKRRLKVVSYNVKLTVSGVLQIGPRKDEQTGFLSMIRLEDAVYG